MGDEVYGRVLNIMAVIQKFFDQPSLSTSYNPQHYPNQEVSAQVLLGDLLKSYKLGIKTLYYQNTYDGKGEEEITEKDLDAEVAELLKLTEDCESCSI